MTEASSALAPPATSVGDSSPPLQPLVSELDVCVLAPVTVLSARDGSIRGGGAEGVYVGDLRVLSVAEVTVAGRRPEGIGGGATGVGSTTHVCVVRGIGDPGADPTVRLERTRRLGPAGLSETLRLVSTAVEPLTAEVQVTLGSDLATIEEVKAGALRPLLPPGRTGWAGRASTVQIVGPPLDVQPELGVLRWTVDLAPREPVELDWSLEVHDPESVTVVPPGGDELVDARRRAPTTTGSARC